MADAVRLFASPLARRLAKAKGLNLGHAKGSGPNGRIIERDLASIQSPKQHVSQNTSTEPVGFFESNTSCAHLALDVEMSTALEFRQNDDSLTTKPSLNDIIIKATALALNDQPTFNLSVTDAGSRKRAGIDIAVIISVPGGQVTSLVEDADRKPLAEIAQIMRTNIEHARLERSQTAEHGQARLTISNLGMYGIQSFRSVKPSQGPALLAIGAAVPKVIVRDGQIDIATMMSVTLSIDLEIIDGTIAARLLQSFKRRIEDRESFI